jgi:hypothetical protein
MAPLCCYANEIDSRGLEEPFRKRTAHIALPCLIATIDQRKLRWFARKQPAAAQVGPHGPAPLPVELGQALHLLGER